ncbi:PT domain-containing protein [Kitasatospora sp. NPDC059571]|uniref:PT domain-containing protein n=1 Tax=Kitasatospora sp. NPDC059571 TaxID=3346871 RepID=UPI0036A7BAD7
MGRRRAAAGQVQPERGLRRRYGALVWLGALLAAAAIFGLLYTAFATVTGMLLFGWLLLFGGLVGLVHAVLNRKENYFWLGSAVAALNLAAGLVLVVRPHAAPDGLTLFAALLFLSAGTFRLVGGIAVRGPQFGWTLLVGTLDVVLGLLVLGQWPSTSRYTLGLYFSLWLLFDGLGLISMGIGGRRMIGMVGEARAAAEAETAAQAGTLPPTGQPAGEPTAQPVGQPTGQSAGPPGGPPAAADLGADRADLGKPPPD